MNKDGRIPSGQEVIEEAANLLRGLTVSTLRGATARGEYTHIVVDPVLDEETDTCNIIFTCYAFGWQQIQWAGLPIILSPEVGMSVPTFVARLDQRGQAMVRSVPSGTYELAASGHWFYSKEPVVSSAFRQVVRSRGEPESNRHSKQGLESTAILTPMDSRIQVKSVQTVPGRLVLYFESRHEELADAAVHFAIISSSGEVPAAGVVVLAGGAQEPGWQGHWEGEFSVGEPCYLMFEIFLSE